MSKNRNSDKYLLKQERRQEKERIEAQAELSRMRYFWICCALWLLGGGYLTWFGFHMDESGTIRVGILLEICGIVALVQFIKKTMAIKRKIANLTPVAEEKKAPADNKKA